MRSIGSQNLKRMKLSGNLDGNIHYLKKKTKAGLKTGFYLLVSESGREHSGR